MEIFILTFSLFCSIILIMSVSILFKRNPIEGSCGGIARFLGKCDLCHKRPECLEARQK